MPQKQPMELFPRHRSLLRSAPQPPIPLPTHLVMEVAERSGVSGNAVIPVVPPELPPQLVCLCFHLVMSMKSAPLGYRLHTPRQTILGRPPFYDPSSLAALPPVMGSSGRGHHSPRLSQNPA